MNLHSVMALAADDVAVDQFTNVCGMQATVDVASVVAQDAKIGFWKGIAFQGMMFASEHPFYTGLAAAAVGMLAVFALRRVLWSTGKWIMGIPMAALAVAAKPVVWAFRKVRNRTSGRQVFRLPLIGEVAYIGPCRDCGTKREYRVRASAYSGGTLRGFDTESGRAVLGCAACTRS
jgi:hypothetical protein